MKEDLFNTENLTVLAEKTLVGLLSVRSSHFKHQNWATLIVDSFEKYDHTKEILLLRNKVAQHPALAWHSLQKNGQCDGTYCRFVHIVVGDNMYRPSLHILSSIGTYCRRRQYVQNDNMYRHRQDDGGRDKRMIPRNIKSIGLGESCKSCWCVN